MKCTLCHKPKEISDVVNGHDRWISNFYVGEAEYGEACRECAERFLQVGYDDELELKANFKPAFAAWIAEEGSDGDFACFIVHPKSTCINCVRDCKTYFTSACSFKLVEDYSI
jgi:hypothetical protein